MTFVLWFPGDLFHFLLFFYFFLVAHEIQTHMVPNKLKKNNNTKKHMVGHEIQTNTVQNTNKHIKQIAHGKQNMIQ